MPVENIFPLLPVVSTVYITCSGIPQEYPSSSHKKEKTTSWGSTCLMGLDLLSTCTPQTPLHLEPALLFHCLLTSPHLCSPRNPFSGGRQLPGLLLPVKLLVFTSCFESSFVKPPRVLLQTPCLLFSCNLYHILFYGDFCCSLFCVSN